MILVAQRNGKRKKTDFTFWDLAHDFSRTQNVADRSANFNSDFIHGQKTRDEQTQFDFQWLSLLLWLVTVEQWLYGLNISTIPVLLGIENLFFLTTRDVYVLICSVSFTCPVKHKQCPLSVQQPLTPLRLHIGCLTLVLGDVLLQTLFKNYPHILTLLMRGI